MRKRKPWGIWGILGLVLLLFGCSITKSDPMEQAIAFRSQLLEAGGCGFLAQVRMDLGEDIYEFTLSCQMQAQGEMAFTVTAPETITGISGTVAGQEGTLSFQDTMLAFSPLAEGQLSPVAAPYTIAQSWYSGYITYCGFDQEYLLFSVDTTYSEHPISAETWMDPEKGVPIGAEVCYNGGRILSVTFSDFHFNNRTE